MSSIRLERCRDAESMRAIFGESHGRAETWDTVWSCWHRTLQWSSRRMQDGSPATCTEHDLQAGHWTVEHVTASGSLYSGAIGMPE